MVLTGNQTTAFFENADQMAIPHATVVHLVTEGIDTVDDLSEFHKKDIENIAANLRRPVVQGAAPLTLGAKSVKRLIVACDLVRYYDTIGRTMTPGNLQWNTVMKNFELQWKALEDKKDGDEPDTPKISKGLNIMRWSEAFNDTLNRYIGVRMIPLAYVVRTDDVVAPNVAPAIAPGQPHSTEHGSVEEELIARASHVHALYRQDNASVYYKLEEATRGTNYAASIKPFQRSKDGRAAFKAIINQFAGVDKWNAEVTKQEAVLHTRKWKGQSNYGLEKHCGMHRNAYVQMEAASQHVSYQLPNGHSRVGYLLASIENNDAGLQAAMANINSDQGVDGMRLDFEKAVAHMLPYCPVAKKKTVGNKRGAADISEVNAEVSSFGSKSGRGAKTGVHLRFYAFPEYKKLSAAEKEELFEWRSTPEGKAATEKSKKHNKGGSGGKSVHFSDKAIAAAVEKKLADKDKAAENDKTQAAAVDGYIMSCINRLAGTTSANKPSPPAKASAGSATANMNVLKSILDRAKNKGSSY
jgi:hypothetical protein